ncbi:MAG: hypothetical protein MI702_03480 [Chlorobiales bacterium]|nr:hypothetical protein [Chlorobiales bacterium]
MIVTTVLLLAFSYVAAEETVERGNRISIEIHAFKDGTFRFAPAKRISRDYGPSDERRFDSATLLRAMPWTAGTKKIVVNFTEFSLKFRKSVLKIVRKYVIQRRGNKNVPKFKLTKNKDLVRPITDFNNPAEFYNQFAYDDKNNVVMTDDDQFFKSPNGIFFNPNQVGITRIWGSAAYLQKGNRFVGTYLIEDVEVYLRSDFFMLPAFTQRLILTGLFKFALGYQKSMTTHDILSDNRQHVSEASFEDKNSDVWQKMAHLWDDFYYADKLIGPEAAAFHSKAKVLPFEGAVIDLADYEVPDTAESNPRPTDNSQSVFVTNLKGFDGKKVFSAQLTALYKDQNSNEVQKKIITLKGNAYDYPKALSVNGKPTNWFPTIFFNHVVIGNQGELNTINNAIKANGSPMTIMGVNFDKALKVEVKFTGYLQEDSKKKNKKVVYYFVNSKQ